MVTQPPVQLPTPHLERARNLQSALNAALNALTNNIKASAGGGRINTQRMLSNIAAVKALHVKLVDSVVEAEFIARPAVEKVKKAEDDLAEAKRSVETVEKKMPKQVKTPHLDKLKFQLPKPTDEKNEAQHEALVKALEEELGKREALSKRRDEAMKQKKSGEVARNNLALYNRKMRVHVNKMKVSSMRYPKNPLDGAVKK